MNRVKAIGLAILSPLLVVSGASASTIYNPQTEFSGSNPSGVWTYGVLSGATLTPFSSYKADNGVTGVDTWSNNDSAPYPGIYDNTNSSSETIQGTIAIPGNSLVLHPPNAPNGIASDQTDLRFKAPTNLTITNISATFAAADTVGTSSDVHVYVDGVSEFSSTVSGASPGMAPAGVTSYNSSGPFVLLAGQTIELRVGDGSNTYSNDGTSLVASITATPEPASVSLAAIGTVGLLAGRRRQA